MAKFVYRMQNILDIKYKLEEQAKTVYMQAKKASDEEALKLKLLMEKKEQYERKLRKVMSAKLDIFKIRQLESAIDNTNEAIEYQKKETIKAYKRMMAAKNHLNELISDRKTHEKLRENAFEEFVKELNDAENKEVDELVSFRYNTKNDE